MGVLDRILHEDEDHADQHSLKVLPEKLPGEKFSKTEIVGILILLVLALFYRLAFIFGVSGPENAGVGWYGDTYHHWQIAYLTLTQGFDHGFLRLWDLKGMEFFWGPLHPLLSILVFKITGSIDIVLMRFLSMFFGMGTLLLAYLLTKKYWGKSTAFAFLIFGSFFPVAVFNDVTGSLEPIGVFLLLLAIYMAYKNQFMSGVFFALAGTVRAEAWFFSLGLLVAIFINKNIKNKLPIFVGWLIVMVLYMKYLLDYTGNPIYPIWWNFLANGAGAWVEEGTRRQLTVLQITVRPILVAMAGVAAAGLSYNLLKRPKGYLLNVFGWGNLFFVGAFMGLSHYLSGWEWWFPVIRFFVWPYLFLSIILFVFLGREERIHVAWKSLLIFSVIIITAVSQLTWLPILKHFSTTQKTWEQNVIWGEEVGKYYKDGTLLFPEGEPNFTYTVVKYGGVGGDNFLSQMFDPYYYIGEEKVYAEWDKNQKAIYKWIKENNIRLAVVRVDNKRYQELIVKRPDLFEIKTTLEGNTYQVYEVFPDKINLD